MRILIAITLLFWAHLASAETVRIASWNIEHLVAENDRGCRPRNDGDFQRVRDVVAQVDADVWLLQEIEGEDALARVFDPAEWVFHVEERRPSRTYPECRNRPGQRLAMQATAIVVRNGIMHQRLPDLTALDVSGRGNMRHGVLIELSSSRPMTILNTHLKSGCFEGTGREACGDLFAQLPVLRTWFDAQRGPVLIGGDLNRRLEVENDVFWAVLNEYNDLHELSLKVGDGEIGWHIKALFTRRSSRREKDMPHDEGYDCYVSGTRRIFTRPADGFTAPRCA